MLDVELERIIFVVEMLFFLIFHTKFVIAQRRSRILAATLRIQDSSLCKSVP